MNFIEFAKKESELTLEEKQTLGTIQKKVNDTVEELLKGLISESSFNEKMKDVDNQLKALNEDGKVGIAIKELEDFKNEIKELSKQLEVLKSKGFNVTNGSNNLGKKIDEFLDSEKFKDFLDGKTKSSGRFDIDLKDVTDPVNMTNDYSGDKLITRQSGVVVTKINEGAHIRDIMTVDQGDPHILLSHLRRFMTWIEMPLLYRKMEDCRNHPSKSRKRLLEYAVSVLMFL